MSISETIIRRFANESGDAEMTVHKVFDGIDLVYNSVHMDRCDPCTSGEGHIIEIRHCKEGRIEQEINGQFFYLMPGDLSVTMRESSPNVCNFPLRHYHGITVSVNTDIAPKCFSCFLEDVNVQPMKVAKRLCGDRNYFIIRNQKYIEHIFSELYSVPESYKKGYFKIKIMELLLTLSEISQASGEDAALSQTQVDMAKKAAGYLAENTDRRVSLEELSREFSISATHLQNAFKGVFGVTIYAYIRVLKMQAAALKLIHSNDTVLEIAGSFGYDNPGKFSSAFKEVMGETPLEYRKRHRK